MKDKEGKELLALVIGKEVPGRPGLRYVRKVGQDAIYVVEAKTDKLSTKFENWIERNLLEINTLRHQATAAFATIPWIVSSRRLIQRGDMVIDYNDTGEPKWKMVEDRKFVPDERNPRSGQWVPVKMSRRRGTQHRQAGRAEDGSGRPEDRRRQPQAGRPERRPEGAAISPRTVKPSNRWAMRISTWRGSESQIELFSNDGEIRVRMKDGVEYVLRFGGIAGSSSPAKKDDKAKDEGPKTKMARRPTRRPRARD